MLSHVRRPSVGADCQNIDQKICSAAEAEEILIHSYLILKYLLLFFLN